MTRLYNHWHIADYIEWEDCDRPDENLLVRVHFVAEDWCPAVDDPDTGYSSRGYFENINIVRIEIDPLSLPADPLTSNELLAAGEWFATEKVQDRVAEMLDREMQEAIDDRH
jgi:hypothetical protein